MFTQSLKNQNYESSKTHWGDNPIWIMSRCLARCVHDNFCDMLALFFGIVGLGILLDKLLRSKARLRLRRMQKRKKKPPYPFVEEDKDYWSPD